LKIFFTGSLTRTNQSRTVSQQHQFDSTMSQDTSALNGLVRQFERIKHATSDVDLQWVITCQTLATHRSWISSSSNFGPKKHDLLYRSTRPNSKASPASPIEKSLNQIAHLKADIQEQVTLALFSACQLQSPNKNFDTRQTHDFIQSRRLPQLTSNTRSGPSPKKEKTTKVMTDNQITNLALRSGILTGKKTTPLFSVQFPNTTWPSITLVLGHPRIDREVFNSLLLSRIRALKTLIAGTGTPVPKQLSKILVLRLSRMIDLGLSNEFHQRKLATKKPTVLPSSSAKAQAKAAKRSLQQRFTPAKEVPAPKPVPDVFQESSTPPLQEEFNVTFSPSPSNPLPLSWDSLLSNTGNSRIHIDNQRASKLLSLHRVLYRADASTGSDLSASLTSAEFDFLKTTSFADFLCFFGVSDFTDFNVVNIAYRNAQAMTTYQDDFPIICKRHWNKFELTPTSDHYQPKIRTPPHSDIINDSVLDYYRYPLSSEKQSFLDTLEILVLSLRDMS
jgi:hypothetical protein